MDFGQCSEGHHVDQPLARWGCPILPIVQFQAELDHRRTIGPIATFGGPGHPSREDHTVRGGHFFSSCTNSSSDGSSGGETFEEGSWRSSNRTDWNLMTASMTRKFLSNSASRAGDPENWGKL